MDIFHLFLQASFKRGNYEGLNRRMDRPLDQTWPNILLPSQTHPTMQPDPPSWEISPPPSLVDGGALLKVQWTAVAPEVMAVAVGVTAARNGGRKEEMTDPGIFIEKMAWFWNYHSEVGSLKR